MPSIWDYIKVEAGFLKPTQKVADDRVSLMFWPDQGRPDMMAYASGFGDGEEDIPLTDFFKIKAVVGRIGDDGEADFDNPVLEDTFRVKITFEPVRDPEEEGGEPIIAGNP